MQLDASPVRRAKGISLTPLIDVVFILLLFFMLSSTFITWRQLDVASPADSNSAPPKDIQLIRLTSNQGHFELEGRVYRDPSRDELAELVSAKPDAVFAIQADAGLHTQALITLLDRLKNAGAAHVSLAEGPK
ncbi:MULTISPECIES: ExbD/TolR family protein [Marinobacter]|uniref:Biopolymer transporter ExbD n=1 Tax=Marinobacter xiaoshiensis TaxID=3073652 RepID=A0ABU2HC79_9GAMM|nr:MULTISPECIES: biopolymer transporter ExbD [unclassified Marinobacter]MBK1872239.1 biopolymer transporter ExbD [Marinobacter sp. 1-3A]MBK1887103.1 biopolymer transporter ExbD [Marinobacter sp. DY40_1A1]MDS1308677.1 biopolymer transporter ExbD [Marinobacter sp. F60267]